MAFPVVPLGLCDQPTQMLSECQLQYYMLLGVHCGCLDVLVLLFCFFFFQICQLLNSGDQLVSFCTSKTLSVIFSSSQMKVSHCWVHLAPKHVLCAVPTIVINCPSQWGFVYGATLGKTVHAIAVQHWWKESKFFPSSFYPLPKQ